MTEKADPPVGALHDWISDNLLSGPKRVLMWCRPCDEEFSAAADQEPKLCPLCHHTAEEL